MYFFSDNTLFHVKKMFHFWVIILMNIVFVFCDLCQIQQQSETLTHKHKLFEMQNKNEIDSCGNKM